MFPVWKSAHYLPIVQKNCIFYEFIKGIYYLSQKDCIFIREEKNRFFTDNPLKFRMVDLRIVF